MERTCPVVYAFSCGVLRTTRDKLAPEGEGNDIVDIPVPFFVLRAGDRWVAFDTGNHLLAAIDPVGYWGQDNTDAFFPVMDRKHRFSKQIECLGLKPRDFSGVVLSHGHMDHAGGIDDFLGTTTPIYVHTHELEQIKRAIASGTRGDYIPDDFQNLSRLNVQPVEGIWDLFGDGSIIIFPTPGHTPGSQALMVRRPAGGFAILASDACFDLDGLESCNPPPFCTVDLTVATHSLRWLQVMQRQGIPIVPMHDPDYWAQVPQAPEIFIL